MHFFVEKRFSVPKFQPLAPKILVTIRFRGGARCHLFQINSLEFFKISATVPICACQLLRMKTNLGLPVVLLSLLLFIPKRFLAFQWFPRRFWIVYFFEKIFVIRKEAKLVNFHFLILQNFSRFSKNFLILQKSW